MTAWLCDIHSSHNQGRYKAVADPDLHIKGGGRSFRPSDKEGRSPKNFFAPFGPNFGLKISALCMVILISESGKFVLVEYAILENISSNPDPTNDCNPKSKFRWQRNRNPRLRIQNPRLSWISLHGSRQANKPERDISTSMSMVEKNTSSLNFRIDFLHSNMQFSTKDADNDRSPISCAQRHSGGWWFNKCSVANPNGLYHNGPYSGQYPNGAKWATFRGQFYSLKRFEMKLKPKE